MFRKSFLRALAVLAVSIIALIVLSKFDPRLSGTIVSAQSETQDLPPGSLQILDENGKPKTLCPLKHTDVKVEISGFLSRVNVTQEFENPLKEKIEAVYVFPLPAAAAVDDMTMVVGDRTVRGKILRREEAQVVYEAAKKGGQVASLLDQERPNIFTQSVANILPREKVKITISYVETLKYEAGAYEFSFPMVVGERYIPGDATGQQAGGTSADTTKVPDASRISPRRAPTGMRAGHDISLDIMLDAGVPIDQINGKSHEVELERLSAHGAHVRLKESATIPNKDFVLRYDVAGKNIQDALLAHRSDKGGYFSMIIQPPERVTVTDVTPKELVFVLDTSGSMEGFPIEKAKEAMKAALDGLYPDDTFNLITFAGDTKILFPAPVRATPANRRKAQAFLASRSGEGGTEMMEAIKAALEGSGAQNHVRIVCFMTDGEVGNDMEIIAEVQKHPNARVFAFGIGSSINRFLLDKMAENGRGDVEYVSLTDDGSAAARRFHERVRNPLLTDISVDWNGLPVTDVYPQRIPDLFGAKPVILTGRYTAGGNGVIRLKGKMSGREFVREIAVDFPEAESRNEVMSSLWARARIDALLAQDYAGAQQGEMKPELKEAITNLGIEYRLMTEFTSFVAVEEMIVTEGGQPRRIDVPVEVPEGVNGDNMVNAGETTLGMNFSVAQLHNLPVNGRTNPFALMSPGAVNTTTSSGTNKSKAKVARRSRGGGGAGGSGSGSGGGVASGVRAAPPPNAPPAAMIVAEVDSAQMIDGRNSLSVEEKQRRELASNLHPSIVALVLRLKDKNPLAGPSEVDFVRDGKAEVQIWLTDKSAENLAKLKELGFEVVLDPKSAKMVIGRLPIEKLAALSELTFVRYVSPQVAGR